MSDWLTEEEAAELLTRAEAMHKRWNLGGAYPLGRFIVDYGFINDKKDVAIYLDNIVAYSTRMLTGHADPRLQHEILTLLRREMILDDLAEAGKPDNV